MWNCMGGGFQEQGMCHCNMGLRVQGGATPSFWTYPCEFYGRYPRDEVPESEVLALSASKCLIFLNPQPYAPQPSTLNPSTLNP